MVMFLNLLRYGAHFSIADGFSIDGEYRDDAVQSIGEEYFFCVEYILHADRIITVINGGDTGSRSYAGENQGTGNARNHVFILGRGPDDTCLDDAHIGMAGFGEEVTQMENGIIAALLLRFGPGHHIVQLVQGKNIAVVAAVIFHGNALHTALYRFNGLEVDGLCINQDIWTKFISGRNGEIMITCAAGHDDFHITIHYAGFVDNCFHNFSKFIRSSDRTDTKESHGTIETVRMIGQCKRMSVENTDPFISAITELEASVVCSNEGAEIVVEIVIVVYGRFKVCHTVHLRK